MEEKLQAFKIKDYWKKLKSFVIVQDAISKFGESEQHT